MQNKYQDSTFLPNMKSVLDCIQYVLDNDNKGDYIYIGGHAVKFLVNQVIKMIDETNFNKSVHIAFPYLTVKDFTYSSLLYQVNDIASKVKITGKAKHNIVLTSHYLILISVYTGTKNLYEDQVTGIVIKDPDEINKAHRYCDNVWSDGFPLEIK